MATYAPSKILKLDYDDCKHVAEALHKRKIFLQTASHVGVLVYCDGQHTG